MDNWEIELTKFLDSVTATVEQFFDEVGQVVEEAAHDFQTEVLDELELFMEEIIAPMMDVEIDISVDIHTSDSRSFDSFEDFFDDSDFDINPKITPSANHHPACMNCQHFHGRIYNGVPLICGMHPDGWEGEDCPDWETD
ncbi:MAG: hypothetical protein AB4058_11820 [Microcystaceae cyanobacterium]